MKIKITLTFVFIFLLFLLSCEDWVSNVDPLIDRVEDERLNSPDQVGFLILGIKTRFATTHDVLMVLSDLLSDQLFFDTNVPNATYPTFAEIDQGNIRLDNNSVDGAFYDLGELRFFADDLIRRVNEDIEFAEGEESVKEDALFNGYLYGGIARYFYAAYFGLNPDEGGGVIDNGPFIPSNAMYDSALVRLDKALEHVNHLSDKDYWTKVINSIKARIYLLKGDYANAKTCAENGLVSGDAPFQSLHSSESDNYYWQQAGAGRTQCVADWRFKEYIDESPLEASRVKLDSIMGNNGVMYYRQGKYPQKESPIDFISWQENNLILAEIALRNGDNATALNLVNEVRQSHGLSDLTEIDMETLMVEKDKELCFTGLRLLDQRRIEGLWHLPADAWKYLPITEGERNINPNID